MLTHFSSLWNVVDENILSEEEKEKEKNFFGPFYLKKKKLNTLLDFKISIVFRKFSVMEFLLIDFKISIVFRKFSVMEFF